MARKKADESDASELTQETENIEAAHDEGEQLFASDTTEFEQSQNSGELTEGDSSEAETADDTAAASFSEYDESMEESITGLGAFVTTTSAVKKIDEVGRAIMLIDGQRILIKDIYDLKGDVFHDLESIND